MLTKRQIAIVLGVALLGVGAIVLMGSAPVQSAYSLIENSGTPLARRQTLNFTGSGVSCADASPLTTCTISGSGASGSGIVGYNGTTTISAAGTTYIPFSGSTPASPLEIVVEIAAPGTTKVSLLRIVTIQSPGVGNSVAFTWRDNGANTALTCTVSGTATGCTDTAHSFTAAPGDLLDISMVATGTFVSLSFFIGEASVAGALSNPGVQKYSQSFSAATSVTLTDDLNTTVKTTQCYDSASPPNLIIPSNVAITDANDVTVTFSSAQSGLCIVQG
jgi:hypothetical protein